MSVIRKPLAFASFCEGGGGGRGEGERGGGEAGGAVVMREVAAAMAVARRWRRPWHLLELECKLHGEDTDVVRRHGLRGLELGRAVEVRRKRRQRRRRGRQTHGFSPRLDRWPLDFSRLRKRRAGDPKC